jgi:hypothetical protein
MRAFLLLLGCSIAGCSSSGGGGGVPLDGGVGGSTAFGGSGGSGGTTTTAPGVPTPTCTHYVSCVAATNATVLGSVIDTYGPNGSCWAQGAELAQTCDSACVQALVTANKAHPDEPECGECKTAADCKDPLRPFWSESTHRCTVSSDPDLPECLSALSCSALGLGKGFACAEESCSADYGSCFGPGGKCATFTTCLEACGGCAEGGCIESCAEQGIPQGCMDECLNPVIGPLYDCMQSNFCGC